MSGPRIFIITAVVVVVGWFLAHTAYAGEHCTDWFGMLTCQPR